MHDRIPRCEKSSRAYRHWRPLLPAGVILLALGLLLMFLCIPAWAWTVLAGLVMIISGYALITLALR